MKEGVRGRLMYGEGSQPFLKTPQFFPIWLKVVLLVCFGHLLGGFHKDYFSFFSFFLAWIMDHLASTHIDAKNLCTKF